MLSMKLDLALEKLRWEYIKFDVKFPDYNCANSKWFKTGANASEIG